MKRPIRRHSGPCLLTLFLLAAWIHMAVAQVVTPPVAVRSWINLQGRIFKGAFVSANSTDVVLRLEDGAQTTLPLATLSRSDQAFVQQQRTQTPPATTRLATPPAAPLTWPSIVTIDPKALNIVVGVQDAKQRQYHYESGSFEFIANAPLAGTVMTDVAADFELVRALFDQTPWGWRPRPKSGTHFRVFLTETLDDFIALGGNDTSGGGSKDDYIFTKFSGLGLKKVGQRYAFDPREKNEGDVIGLTYRLLLGDMISLTYPWARQGMEELTRKVAYHKGTLRFTGLEKPVKDHIEEQAKIGVKIDVDRMLAFLRTTAREQRSDVVLLRRQYYLDGLMLTYFFGFLDGDGKGTRLHQYFRSIAQESMAWRAYRESAGTTPRPRESGAYPEWSQELLNTLIGNRTDAQLRAELIAKYRTINVKLE